MREKIKQAFNQSRNQIDIWNPVTMIRSNLKHESKTVLEE